MKEVPNLTDEEKVVLHHLSSSYNEFVKLPVMHPNHQTEFMQHIHELQRLVGIRVARRADPDIWS